MSNVKVMHLDDWCYMNDSAKAMKICTAEQMHPMTKMPAVAAPHMPMTMPMTAAALQNLCDGSDCNQMHFQLQNLDFNFGNFGAIFTKKSPSVKSVIAVGNNIF